jgi:gliding motility-associated-like protein
MFYDDLGSGNYKIHMKAYRDCSSSSSGAAFDNPAFFTVYDVANNVVTTFTLAPLSILEIPPSINSNCIQPPLGEDVCVEEAIYEKTITLPPLAGGYTIVYQRCCRNATIINLNSPSTLGGSYFTHIPGPEVVTTNSSPRFQKFPPLFVCNGRLINFDHSATDPDGDSLVYSLCAPYDGLDQCCPTVGSLPNCPNPPPSCPPVNTPPPYTPLTFIAPYSSSYPLSSSPAININPSTGFLDGVPNINGQWIVGVCVEEYRGGQLIGVHRREFQFNVVSCIIQIQAEFNDQSAAVYDGTATIPNQFCTGTTIIFSNFSQGGSSYHWDFGVNGILSDTSNLANPTYTYPDTGRYVITLIVNPGNQCSDTTKRTYYVYPLLKPTFTAPPPQCLPGNSFNFSVGGAYQPYATFYWTFGPNASPANSPSVNPPNISYNSPGKYTVFVDVKQNVCKKTLIDTVQVYQPPEASFVGDTVEACDPATITFTNTSQSSFSVTYTWYFSDGTTSSLKDPTHVFTPAGVYNVTLSVNAGSGCVGTSSFVVPGMVNVYPAPFAAFSFSPSSTTIFEPDIYFTNESVNCFNWSYDFGDGNFSQAISPIHSYNNYGDFKVILTAGNEFGCIDTCVRVVQILPEFKFWVPNSFTPGNKDGMNDVFTPIVICAEEYEFYVYDRWGGLIFKSKTPGEGWDGTFKGKPCQTGTYNWFINFINAETERYEEHRGHVNLLK